ncbi:hypothetical protein [Candidatus Nitrosotenuis sp. DW1]|uniref:hypothetical protein n=1 Tax=Candidatus Nitrosotenuis sp. DW1 TaxID=2259672 RepID=UPI0015CE4B1C|nr:hypothetical protein [Candidatus Nitrosotenuis sp. DW1]QLH09522.1 hypothetical protein DSQ19_08605 [Candidatus Nitrosotenuis sp. DW1]
MLAKKNIGIIAGVAAAIAIGFAAYVIAGQDLTKQDLESDMAQDVTGEILGPSPTPDENAGMYKINTECELIYAIAYGKYPDGKELPDVKVEVLLANYPEEFKPWKEDLQNIENRTAFFAKPLSDEFRNVLTPALMKEASINPVLEQTARIVSDGNGKEKLQQAFQEFGCQKYFDERK